MSISVLMVGCCEIDFRGLRTLTQGTDVVIEYNAPSGRSASSEIAIRRYDVLLIDIQIPDRDPFEFAHEVRSLIKDQAILFLTSHENPSVIAKASAMGALGVVARNETFAKCFAKIQSAAKGSVSWTRDELRRTSVSASAVADPRDYHVPLTQREKEVLKHLASGGTNRDIAALLGISYETVKEHVQHILQKIGVIDRSQAAIWAVHQQIV